MKLKSVNLVFTIYITSNDDAAVKEFKRLAKIEENVIRDLVINLDK